MPAQALTTVHATALVVGEAGVLIRGASGRGKTSLALAILDRASIEGRHAGLVGDDRIGLEVHHGRVVARGHPRVSGLVEIRGHGICRVAEPLEACVIRLVVDLTDEDGRLPETAFGTTDLAGIGLPVLRLGRQIAAAHLAGRLVLDALGARDGCVAARTHRPILAPWQACDP